MGTTTNRYAKYIEDAHKVLIEKVSDAVDEALNSNPYTTFERLDLEDAFFLSGYAIGSYPTLYDMFGKFMAGLDIEVLFTQALDDTINNTAVENAISRQAQILRDELDNVAAPKVDIGMRDLNAVNSSSFVIARALLENERLKALANYSSSIQLGLIPTAAERWRTHLEWNRNVVAQYADMLKFYFLYKTESSKFNYDIQAKAALWPFGLYEFERTVVGTLQGAMTTKTESGNPVLGTILSVVGLALMFA